MTNFFRDSEDIISDMDTSSMRSKSAAEFLTRRNQDLKDVQNISSQDYVDNPNGQHSLNMYQGYENMESHSPVSSIR